MGGWQYYVDEIRGPHVAGGTFTPFTAKVASSSFLSSLVVPPLRCGGLPSAANSSARRRLAPDVLRKGTHRLADATRKFAKAVLLY